MSLRYRVGAAAVVMVFLGGACGGDDGGSPAAASGDSNSEQAASSEGSTTLSAANFAFNPSSLTAASGDAIEFTNEDDAKHNFTAEDAGLDVDIDAMGSATIDLSGVDAGTYDYYCEYHKDSMKGTLEVTG